MVCEIVVASSIMTNSESDKDNVHNGLKCELALVELLKFLPPLGKLTETLKEDGLGAVLLERFVEYMTTHSETNVSNTTLKELKSQLEALVERYWERIHTGHYSEVPMNTRKVYSCAVVFAVICRIYLDFNLETAEHSLLELDKALMIGSIKETWDNSNALTMGLIKLVEKLMPKCDKILPVIEIKPYQPMKQDVPQLMCPSVENFNRICYDCELAALLLNTFDHWPAREKWRDLNYILDMAGNRTVPVEIGSNYAHENWSQQLLKFRNFLMRQFGDQKGIHAIEYLAQYELFDQVPSLMQDIRIPDYCLYHVPVNEVNVKAWLGPKGTISPLHYDAKHNLLCQVFGTKYILLAEPQFTKYLYQHPTQYLHNTSQVDADNLDFEKFPLSARVNFMKVILQPGDCLYIPPKWWHYVRAESESFSVSFWW